ANGTRIWLTVAGCTVSGAIPAARKKNCAAHQADTAGADMLKSARTSLRWRFASQTEITSPSNAPTIVPADGPSKRTAMKTKTAETESEVCDEGRSTGAEPLISVRAARRNHCHGITPVDHS